MTSLVLSQPMLLPWRGMFEQAMLADKFVFHDNIPLPRSHGKSKSFQTRVQIKTAGGPQWLSLPIEHGQAPGTLIKDARLAGQEWRRTHLEMIRNAYRKAPFFEHIYHDLLVGIYEHPTDYVAEFCAHGMLELFAYLGIRVPVQWTSNLPIPEDTAGSRRVLEHCLLLETDVYITGLGAMNYIDYDLFERHGVSIRYMDYALTPYPQRHGAFDPYVSIIDLLFNVGPDFAHYLGSEARYWKEMDVEARERVVK